MENNELIVNPGASNLLTEIGHSLANQGVQAYLVGGFVRDILMGRDTADIDIAVSADALKVARGIATTLGGSYVPLDEENGVGRVVLADNKWQIDFTTIKGDINTDLSQRDFTIDAMAVRLDDKVDMVFDTASLIDPYNGREDVSRRLVRAIDDDIFTGDAARLLRAVRIAAELDFNIESSTEALIREYSRLIIGVAGERVREELLRLLAIPGAGLRLAYLDELGLLTALIPELVPARGVDQPKVHIWDVFDHSIQTVAAVEFVLREGTWEYAGEEVLSMIPWSAQLSEHFDRQISSGSTGRSLLKLTALLHDIAKPHTKTMDDDGRARFLGHPQEGAAAAAEIMERLRFSNREIKLVELLVTYHLRPMQMSNEGLPTDRAIYRYFRDTGEAGIDLLFLCLADHLATRGRSLDMDQWREHTRMTEYVLARHLEEEAVTSPPKLLDGNDIMETFNLEPGPKVGELLESLRETQAAGEITTREQALDYIRGLIDGNT